MKAGNIFLTFLVIIVLIGGFFFYERNRQPTNAITFPKGGETLVTGEKYTLKWKNVGETGSPNASTTQIFLIDQSLLNQGASVSIIDRTYDVPDTGSYEYTVPTGAADGTYFFVIGTTTSNTFKISSE